MQNWLWSGGQSGISMSLLATATNVQRIEAGLYEMPDVAAAADLQKLLLSYYTDSPEGFTKLFNERYHRRSDTADQQGQPMLGGEQDLQPRPLKLVTQGGQSGNSERQPRADVDGSANVATLVPTQNEIDLEKSLIFPSRTQSNFRVTSPAASSTLSETGCDCQRRNVHRRRPSPMVGDCSH